MLTSSPLIRRLDPLLPILVPAIAVAAALGVSSVFLLALGADPIAVYQKLLSGATGDAFSQGQTIGKATPLLLVALGVCIAFRANVLNIGVEGQVVVGGLAATAFAIGLKSWPGPILLVGAMLVGMLAGAVWAGIPGVLKAWMGVNEILSTIMMNQIAVYLLLVLLTGPMQDTGADLTSANIVQSAQIPPYAWLPALSPQSGVNLGIVIAILASFVVFFFLWRTVAGYRIRAVGANPHAAAYAGISVRRITLLAMLLSGSLAGLAGAIEVLGVTHRALQDFSTGYGFSGIVVALFGSLHPLAAIPASLLFGGLLVSGNKLQTVGVSSAMVTVLEGTIVLFVVGSSEWTRRARRSVMSQSQPEAESPIPVAPSDPASQEGQ